MVRKSKNGKMKRKPKVLVPEATAAHPRRKNGAYQPWMCETAKELVGKLGARIDDLAEFFGVCPATIDYWIKNREDFRTAVRFGRMECKLKVSQALFNRAIGYSHPDTHIISNRVKVYDEQGNLAEERTEALMVPITKHYPPDTAAAIKYLSIIAREQGWSEIHKVNMDVNHTGDINIHKVEELSMEDLSDEVKNLLFDLNLKQLSDAQTN